MVAADEVSVEREALWARLEKATFLTPNEKRSAVGYGPIAGGDEIKKLADALDCQAIDDLSHKYPGQPRTDAGRFDFGKDPNRPQPAARNPRPPPRPPRPPRSPRQQPSSPGIGHNRPPRDSLPPETVRQAIDDHRFIHDLGGDDIVMCNLPDPSRADDEAQ